MDPGKAFCSQARCDFPGRWSLARLGKRKPCTLHICKLGGMVGSSRVVTQIADRFAIDFVSAHRAGIELVREPLIGFEDRCGQIEGEVQRRHTLEIEAAAMYCCAIAGERLKSPRGIMRPIGRPPKSQAKPPVAMTSR